MNLGGDGAKLVPGADYLPNGAVIQLQSQYADGELTFANGFELGGKTQKVNVWIGKTATISGAVSDEVGGGKLDVTGSLDFAGALEVAEANIELNAAMVTVSSNLSFSAGATVRLPASVTPADMKRMWAQHSRFGVDGMMWLGFGRGGRDRDEGLRVQSFLRNAPGVVQYRLRNAASNVLMFL